MPWRNRPVINDARSAEVCVGRIVSNATCGRSMYGYFRNGCAVERRYLEDGSGSRSTHPSPKHLERPLIRG